LAWLIHRTPTTELEDQQDSILPATKTALVPIHSIAWITAQHFSYGARVLFARPSERSERLKLFVMIGILHLLRYSYKLLGTFANI
jgi:hypothetical protein